MINCMVNVNKTRDQNSQTLKSNLTSRIRDDNDGKTVLGDGIKSTNEIISQGEKYSENKNVQ